MAEGERDREEKKEIKASGYLGGKDGNLLMYSRHASGKYMFSTANPYYKIKLKSHNKSTIIIVIFCKI